MDLQDVGIGRVNPEQENPKQPDADCGMLEGCVGQKAFQEITAVFKNGFLGIINKVGLCEQ